MYIVFDIGGTHTRVAGSRDGKVLENILIEKTPVYDFNAGMDVLVDLITRIADKEQITSIGGGVAGVFDHDKTTLLNSPNISTWIRKPLKKTIEEKLNTPVFLHNDAALAGLGETVYGAGRKYALIGYITVGTGIGGARIVNKNIDQNIFGFEPGQQIVDVKNMATLESLIGGRAVGERFGKNPGDILNENVWEESAQILAVCLNNIAVLWSPEVIILGGSMVLRTPGISISSVEKYFKKMLNIFPQRPEIKTAELGEESGLYGALALAQQQQ